MAMVEVEATRDAIRCAESLVPVAGAVMSCFGSWSLCRCSDDSPRVSRVRLVFLLAVLLFSCWTSGEALWRWRLDEAESGELRHF